MRNEPKKIVNEQVAAELERWRSMTPAEKRAYREQQRAADERAEEQETERLRVSGEKLDTVLSGFKALARGVPIVKGETYVKARWENSVRLDMLARGVPGRLCQRTVNWNQPDQERVFRQSKDMLRGCGAIVALCGKRGTGKSTIAAQIMRERLETCYEYDRADVATRGREPLGAGRYEKLLRLGVMFKGNFASFGTINGEKMQGIYESWVRLPLVIIDELHDAETIQPAMTMLVDFIDRRYAENRDTLLISNRSAEEFRKEMNASIISRLSEHGALFSCEWASWRTQRP